MTEYPSNKKKPCGMCLYRVGFGLTFISIRLAVNKKTARQWFIKDPQSRPLRRKAGVSWKNGNGIMIMRRLAQARATQSRLWISSAINHSHDYFSAENARYYYQNNKSRIAIVIGARLANRPDFKIVRRLRTRTWQVIRDQGGRRLKSWTRELIGCDRATLMHWLQSQFKRGMNWNNYGRVWEIDHRIPCSKFNLLNEAEQAKCFHYTNLQPLFKSDNRKKHATIHPTQTELLIHLS